MTDIRSINPEKFNKSLAEALKNIDEFKEPEWLAFVKSGTHKSRPVTEPDFWQKRAASILRQIYIRKIVGVQRLRTRYGGRKEMGAKPPRFKKGAGKMIRVILQQAESAGLVEKSKENKAGRQLTSKGNQLMESIK